ncbi:MAG: hypothetical protein G01um101429_219 [Parcubacteria group bacterium Gr01-1014_29]|nr:MAG: hypothetical protein G01um101429_219 [Parcubacteria group bacterium Gr01-1014_29]
MLFGNKRGTTNSIAFDCGTSSVRASLLSYASTGSGEKPTVTQVIRVPFDVTEYIDAHILRRRTWDGMRRTLEQIPKNYRPKHIVVGLSSPFYIAKTSRITRERTTPQQPITTTELEALISHGKSMFTEETVGHTGGHAITIFNTMFLKTYVNGYRTPQPVGTEGKIIETYLRLEGTTEQLYQDFTGFFSNIFPDSLMHLVSIPTANYYALRSILDSENGFLLIDIGGEISDVSLIVYGILERVVTMPLGNNTFLRQAASLFGISVSDVLFLVRRYSEHTLDEKQKRRLDPLIEDFRNMWRARLMIVFEQYAKNYEIPPHILFTGGGTFTFGTDMLSQDFLRGVAPQKNISISLATPALMDTRFAKHPFGNQSDFGLACLSLLWAEGIL